MRTKSEAIPMTDTRHTSLSIPFDSGSQRGSLISWGIQDPLMESAKSSYFHNNTKVTSLFHYLDIAVILKN